MKVTGKQLYDIVSQGNKPTIQIKNISDVDESIWCEGMIGRVESGKIDYVDDTEGTVYCFNIREDLFRDMNSDKMVRNYYDSNGYPTLTYVEAGCAPENGVESLYVMGSDEVGIIITESKDSEFSPIFFKYLSENSELTYVQWLELKLTESMTI